MKGYGGADGNPAWYYNIVAHPDDLGVEIGSEALDATAEILREPERTAYGLMDADLQNYRNMLQSLL